MEIRGKTAIVTGASRGIGRALALALVRRGAKVAIAARSVEKKGKLPGTLGETLAELRAAGGQVIAVQADMARPEDLERLVAETLEAFGGLDILINNAADTRIHGDPIETYPREKFRAFFETNVYGPFDLMALAVPHMKAGGGGVIINFTSGAARLDEMTRGRRSQNPAVRVPALLGYSASKAALDRLSNAVAPELAEANIAVVVINPGATRTELMDMLIEQGGIDRSVTHAMDVPVRTALGIIEAADPLLWAGKIVDAAEWPNG